MTYRKTVLSASIVAALLFTGAAVAHESHSSARPDSTAQGVGQESQSTTSTTRAVESKKNTPKSNAEIRATKLKAVEVIGGIAGSQAQDLILKRYAPQITDSITAINIGQLPDVTITDALARIPGVRIGRSGGEGTTVSVRGLSQVANTLNGEVFLTRGGAASVVNLINIPPTMFKGADVIKSITASNVAGGISGIINLRTYRPFDFDPGWTFSGSATGNWGARMKKLNKAGAFLTSYHDDRWGALLNVSYSKENITNDVPRASLFGLGSKATEQDVGFDFNGDGTIGSSLDPTKTPRDYYYRWTPADIGNIRTHRRRIGLNGSFQFKFSDALELTADATYTEMKQNSLTRAIEFQTPIALQSGPVAPVITPDGHLIKGIQQFAEVTSEAAYTSGPTNAINTNLQLKYDAGGFFSGQLRWVHGHSNQRSTSVNGDLDVNQGNVIPLPDGTTALDNPNGVPNQVPVMLDYSGKYPVVNILENVANPDQWVLISNFASGGHNHANMNVFRADGTLHFGDASVLDSFQFGARYEKQDFVSNQYVYLTPVNAGGGCADPYGPGPADALYQYLDPRIVDFCTGYSPFLRRQVSDLPAGLWSLHSDFSPMQLTSLDSGSRGLPGINPQVLSDPIAFLKAMAGSAATGDPKAYANPTTSWAVTEKIKTLYGQFNLSGQIGSVPWRANVGIRGVQTILDIGSYITTPTHYLGNGGSWDGVLLSQGTSVHENKYTTWLPAVNVSFNTTPDQVLRLAFNRTQARQSLPNLGRGARIGYIVNGNPPKDPSLPQDAQIFVNGSSGNPDLKPYRSTNYDLSYGWYFAPHSLVYVGAFFMDVASFPLPAVIQERLPDADGVVRRSGPVTTIINGGGSIIRGLEGEFRTQFTFLPGWLSGFGTNLNYTYVKSSSNGAAGASNNYNAIVFYQKYNFQARLAYNWQSKTFISTNNATGDPLNIFLKPQGYLDASVQYNFNKHLSLVLQATNLTDEHGQQYIQNEDAWWADNISERRYYAGLRVRF